MKFDPTLGTLSPAGALAAVAVGTTVLWGAGWWGGVVLLTFFVSSTALSHLCPDPAAERGDTKGGRRDAGQVLANGGAPALGALLGLAEPTVGFWVLSIGLASATADTWATALGATSTHPPRHLLTGLTVPAGTSGGVTLRGSLGGILGAASIGGVAWLATGEPRLLGACVTVGTLGMLVDSLLGAALQGRFHCSDCDSPTERARHRCGSRTLRVGGIAWLTNDGVNLITTALATATGWWIVASMS